LKCATDSCHALSKPIHFLQVKVTFNCLWYTYLSCLYIFFSYDSVIQSFFMKKFEHHFLTCKMMFSTNKRLCGRHKMSCVRCSYSSLTAWKKLKFFDVIHTYLDKLKDKRAFCFLLLIKYLQLQKCLKVHSLKKKKPYEKGNISR